MKVQSQDKVNYNYNNEDLILQKAAEIAKSKLSKKGQKLTEPNQVGLYLQALYQNEKQEHFGILCLDVGKNLIDHKVVFKGSSTGCEVTPREIVKIALGCDADSIILFHNHPSGNPRPSVADLELTKHLKLTLEPIGLEILDHFIVGLGGHYSFVENGNMY